MSRTIVPAAALIFVTLAAPGAHALSDVPDHGDKAHSTPRVVRPDGDRYLLDGAAAAWAGRGLPGAARCGDGIIDAGEECDDANLAPGDGCDGLCRVEPVDVGGGGRFAGGFQDGSFDRFTLVVLDRVRVTIAISDGEGGCPGDTTITAFARLDADAPEPIAFDDDGGAGTCSLLVVSIGAGRYDFVVAGFSGQAVADYVADVDLADPSCGDGFVDVDEECDDGDGEAGDGCDTSCTVEPIEITGGGRFRAGFKSGSLDRFVFTLDRAARMTARVIEPFGCPLGARARIVQLDAGDPSEALVFSTYFVNFCPQIEEKLGPGRYELLILDAQGPLTSYVLDVSFEEAVCGDSIIDFGEQCDDGASASGDGCDESCMVEPTDISGGGVFEGGFQDGSFDVFTFGVEAPIRLRAEVSDGALGCPSPFSMMMLVFRDGLEVAGAGENTDYCPLLVETLPPGDYELFVGSYSGVASYQLRAEFATPACGDGVLDPGGPDGCYEGNPFHGDEECDDGNRIDGDGCSGSCTVEPIEIGTDDRIEEVLEPGVADRFTFEVATTQRVTAKIDDGLGACPAPYSMHSTLYRLYEDGGRGYVASSRYNDADCPLLVAAVEAGRYEIVIEGFGISRPVPYFFNVAMDVPACGDRVVDVGANEECDDGNLAPEDGCDASCRVESTEIDGPGHPSGSVEPDSFDRYTLDVRSATRISAVMVDPQSGGCPGPPNLGMRLFGGAGSQSISTYGVIDDSGCRRLRTALAPGAYELQVLDWGIVEPTPYELAVDFAAPECGDGIVDGGIGEECDDANDAEGDGCDPACLVEPTDATGGGRFEDVIDPDSFDRFVLTIEEPSRISARVSDRGGGCLGLYDITIDLVRADGEELRPPGSDGFDEDASGEAACPVRAQLVEPGQYQLIVAGSGDAVGQPYVLDVDVAAPICGDGVIDAGAGDECDDGNATDGDGCDGACLVEPVDVTGGGIFEGGFEPGSLDRYSFTLDEAARVVAETSDGAGGCRNRTRITLLEGLPGGDPEEILDNWFGPGCTCSFLVATIDAGSYQLVVDSPFGDAIDFYVLEVSMDDPICGDGIRDGDEGEACDGFDDLACPGQCQPSCTCGAQCGNALVDFGEACDDGNTENGDACSASCVERCGDFDGDGDLDTSDAAGALRAVVGLTDCGGTEISICDTDGDGNESATDVLRILQRAIAIDVELLCPAI